MQIFLSGLLLCSFLFAGSVSEGASARPEVKIPAKVEVSQKPVLLLGDVAEVKGADEALVQLLDKVVLRQEARELLLSQKLKAHEVILKLREAMDSEGLRDLNPQFSIPSEVEVQFSKNVISKDELLRRLTNKLQARCQKCQYQIQLQNLPHIQNHDWVLDLSSLSTRGSFLVPVLNSQGIRQAYISGSVKVTQLTPVTTRMVLQGERLLAEDIKLAMTDVTFAKDAALSIEDLKGQVAARNLSVGTAIWSADIRREPAAKRGQLVKALLGNDGFEITTNMIAEDNGFVGDAIRLKNPETQKILSGVILEKGVVQLQ